MAMNPVVHFEMPTKDKKRTADFYTNAFGWNMKQLGQEMGDYLLANTTETDENTMRPKAPGTINGGFFDYKDEQGYNAPHIVISVDNLEESMKKVTESGGKIMGNPMEIPNVGTYVSFVDTEDNTLGMLQPSNR